MDFEKYEFKLRKKFGFFYVKEEYINYLKLYDQNVCDNYHETRPYIGIIIEVNNHKYLAPLTSPSKKYLSYKKYRRIVHPINNAKNGYVRIGNMIPVTVDVIEPVIISAVEDEFYKNILLEQLLYLRKDYVIEKIRKQANSLYTKRYNNDNHYLAKILCNYKLLEQKCNEYIKQ